MRRRASHVDTFWSAVAAACEPTAAAASRRRSNLRRAAVRKLEFKIFKALFSKLSVKLKIYRIYY